MKALITALTLMACTLLATPLFAATTFSNNSTATGWGPSVAASVSKFKFNGDYSLAAGGLFVGAAYTWDQKANVNSAGLYFGPSTMLMNGVTTTTLDVMAYVNLFTTSAYNFGLGLGTTFWKSGTPIGKATTIGETYFAASIRF